ncbi:MAG: hypothetical protein IJG84_06990 [Kiritimatiellae bacterium]|nr:hypothetical protein [Kiritimatiellia bacterium]
MSSNNLITHVAPKCAARRRFAGMGTSPAVLTEAVWALAVKVKGGRKDEIDFQA